MTLKVGKPDVSTDLPSHTEGNPQGNAKGNYEKMAGHTRDGKSNAKRSTGVNPGFQEPIDPKMPNLSPP
jgi:hypothetical protein